MSGISGFDAGVSMAQSGSSGVFMYLLLMSSTIMESVCGSSSCFSSSKIVSQSLKICVSAATRAAYILCFSTSTTRSDVEGLPYIRWDGIWLCNVASRLSGEKSSIKRPRIAIERGADGTLDTVASQIGLSVGIAKSSRSPYMVSTALVKTFANSSISLPMLASIS